MSVKAEMTQFDEATGAKGLSRLEWRVVSLALKEAMAAGWTDLTPLGRIGGGIGRLFRAITGMPPRTGLADPRLETLRRFVCLSYWRHRAAGELADRLVDLGFSRAQVRAVATLAVR